MTSSFDAVKEMWPTAARLQVVSGLRLISFMKESDAPAR